MWNLNRIAFYDDDDNTYTHNILQAVAVRFATLITKCIVLHIDFSTLFVNESNPTESDRIDETERCFF